VLFNVAAARPGADMRAAYHAAMDRTYGLPGTSQDDARFTLDQEVTLGAADYLRGWLLGAQLRAALIKKFGSSWWTDPAAGAFLKPLLAPGNAMDADGLGRALGDTGVSADAFVAAIVPRLSGMGSGSPGASPPPTPAPASPAAPAAPPVPPANASSGTTVPASGSAAPAQLDAGTAPTEARGQ